MKFFRLLSVISLIVSMAGVPFGCRANSTDQTTAQTTTQVETTPTEKSPQTADAPELFIAERSHRFSNVVAGQSVSHDFIIKNRGTAPLHVSRVKTG